MARFLIVDDDPSAVRALEHLLRDDGHDVASFTSGSAAVDALSREPFDAVVTDLEMPATDGHAVVHAAREHQPGACVIVASAAAHKGRERLRQAGACVIADKPIDYDGIERFISKCRSCGGAGVDSRCSGAATPEPSFELLRVRRQ